jgi:hypothetical protein
MVNIELIVLSVVGVIIAVLLLIDIRNSRQ